MFLQTVNKDTIGDMVETSSSNDITPLLIGVILIAIILYFILKSNKKVVDETEVDKEINTIQEDEILIDFNLKLSNSVERKKEIITTITDKKSNEKLNTETVKVTPVKIEEPKPQIVPVEPEEQTKEKYIGYNPINVFAQTEPLYFPYVMMPKPNCVIKFPRKGRTGRRGFKEEAFKEYIEKYFKSHYQVFDDRFVLVANNSKPYEPDFTLINEKDGINIFVDIEIDEPYEGTNDIENRKPTHFKYSDSNRNLAFTNRGWIVIRFAEIQVHQQPDACCKFIAHILKSIHPQYVIPESLTNQDKVKPIQQWTEEEAKQWSLEKYRERYLGIERFGVTANVNQLLEVEETDLGETIEELVEDDTIKISNQADSNSSKVSKLFMASALGKFSSFDYKGEKRLIKPTYVYDHEVTGFCYVKNEVKTYSMVDIENVEIKDNYYLLQYYKNPNSIDEITKIISEAIEEKKHIRIVYTKPGNNYVNIDLETGEIIENITLPEETERTLSDIDLSINVLSPEHIESYRLDQNYVSGYCHTRNEIRTFKFNRIGKIEILDI
ncbi:MAG: hypothetical protein ACOVMG_02800 [Flavobacterium sp.]